LIDPNETVEESAIRELVEETGYGKDKGKVEVINRSSEMMADPGGEMIKISKSFSNVNVTF
jgi:8-oxo-dGTP pyrophosphatase MutT (NUDIX family)